MKQKSASKFLGECLNIGEEKTLTGLKQALAYCYHTSGPFRTRKPSPPFKVGNHVYARLGTLETLIPIPGKAYSLCQVDVGSADIFFLIGLDFPDAEKLVADNVDNMLLSRIHNWEIRSYVTLDIISYHDMWNKFWLTPKNFRSSTSFSSMRPVDTFQSASTGTYIRLPCKYSSKGQTAFKEMSDMPTPLHSYSLI